MDQGDSHDAADGGAEGFFFGELCWKVDLQGRWMDLQTSEEEDEGEGELLPPWHLQLPEIWDR